MRARAAAAARPLLLLAALAACRREPPPPPGAAPAPTAATPDRLARGERLPESETAFGLALPSGMRLVRHFNRSAYFAGKLPVATVLEHIARHVTPRDAQLMKGGAVFPRVLVAGASDERQLRVEVRETSRGTQVYLVDVTPPPALSGLSEAESWQRAGRKPDGTPLDPNQLY